MFTGQTHTGNRSFPCNMQRREPYGAEAFQQRILALFITKERLRTLLRELFPGYPDQSSQINVTRLLLVLCRELVVTLILDTGGRVLLVVQGSTEGETGKLIPPTTTLRHCYE